jgi:hypothetical protein
MGEVHIARDGAGNIYMTGTTRSANFPTTAYDDFLRGGADLFVTKFSPAGTVLYSTYLGGYCEDYGNAIAVDSAGNAYVAGEVNGGGACYSTPGALVAKLDPAGHLVYSMRLGGHLLDSSYATGIAVDAAGHAYVTGRAKTSDFPTTPGAYRMTGCIKDNPMAGDVFVSKLSVDGGSLVYSTLLCGKGDDRPGGHRQSTRPGTPTSPEPRGRATSRWSTRSRRRAAAVSSVQRVRDEAERHRFPAPLLDVPRRLGQHRDQRHRARRSAERLRDGGDEFRGFPDHARRHPAESGEAALHRGMHRRLRLEDRAKRVRARLLDVSIWRG